MTMLKTIKIILSLLLIVSMNACRQNKIQEPKNLPGPDKIAEFDKLINFIADDLDIDSYSYAIITNKRILNFSDKGIPADMVVPVGILSNMFISTIVLQLAEKEKINIQDYVADYGMDDPQLKNVRIKGLLSHTSEEDAGTIYRFNQQRFELLKKAAETASGKDFQILLKSSLKRGLGMKKTRYDINHDDVNSYSCYSTLSDLITFSMAIDNHELFKEEDSHEMMFRPVYLKDGERTPSALGCFVQFYGNNKYIWSFGQGEGYSCLMLKSVTDTLTFIMLADNEKLNTPFDPERGDIWSSPIAIGFLKIFSIDNDTVRTIDYYSSTVALKRNLEIISNTEFRDLAVNELSDYIRLYHSIKKTDRYNELVNLYQDLFPFDLPAEFIVREPLAIIKDATDYVRIRKSFTLDNNSKITVFAAGEFTKELTLSPWEYDNVEMFFDLNHERGLGFNSGADDRQYRYNYDFPGITGNAPTFDSILLVQYDASPTQFNFEIAIPWNILFNSDSIKPKVNQLMGFDIAIADNDAEVREGSLAWHSKLNETPWSNTSTYGTMILANSAGNRDDTLCYAIAALNPVGLDGQNKGEWNNIPRYPIDNEFMEGITGPDDQSGWFRTQWDEKNLYFLVEVQDDVKRLMDKSGDYGWITSAKGDTVWMMKEEHCMHAGGSISNKYVYTTIPLKAGNYTLHYQSNQTHSYGRWVNERPKLSFYGIALYR